MPVKIEDIIEYAKKNGVVLAIVFYLIILSHYVSTDPNILYSGTYFYSIIIMLPIILGIGYFYKSVSFDKSAILKPLFAIIAFVLFFYGISRINIADTATTSILFFFNIIVYAIAIIALILFFKVFKNIAYSMEGTIGIIVRGIFFIPCLLSDLFTYIVGEFAKSPLVVYVLLAIEVALILAYVYLPKYLAMFAQKSGKKILNMPVLLTKETNVSSFAIKTSSSINKYAFSGWFYVVGMPKSQYPYNEEARIFELTDNHPKIMYDGSTNMCRVYYSNSPSKFVEFKITLQKWVHFVISYSDNNIDIFINGELKKTVPRVNNAVLSTPTDVILVGQEKGLHGGICNIIQYGRSLTNMEIKVLYGLNKDVDPPIN